MFNEIDKELRGILPFVLMSVAINHRQVNVYRDDGFTEHQFIWVSEGKGTFEIDGVNYILEKNQGVFFRRKVPHKYFSCGETFRTSWLTFYGCDEVLNYYKVQNYFTFTVDDFIENSLTELNELCQGNSTAQSRSVSGYGWLIRILEEVFKPFIKIETKVQRYMENNFHLQITLDDIANCVNLNRFSLCKYYNKNCGITPLEQLKKIRIAKAKHYLRYSGKKLDEIGKLCGFESASYFAKRFREDVKLTPSQYRKKELY